MRIDARVRVGVVMSLCFLLALTYTFKSNSQELPKVISPSSHYVSNHNSSRVIVFVHGLNGNARDTWLFDPSHYWPQMVADDPAFTDTDVYAASYPTPARGNHMVVNDLISYLADELQADAVFSHHKQVIFVAHSLGGIVVQDLLVTYRDKNLAAEVPFIYFYATPQEGSDLANIGQLFRKDPLIKELTHNKNNFVLPSIQTSWLHAGFQSIKRYCAYETQTEKGFQVVSPESATRGCDDQVAIDSNHRSIVKPQNTEARSYTALRNKFTELTASATAQSAAAPGSGQMFEQNNFGGTNFQVGTLFTGDPGRRLKEDQIRIIIDSLKQVPSGHLSVVEMLPMDKEMREFGSELRYAATQGGWTQDGQTMDTSRIHYAIDNGSTVRTNVPQGTHCVAGIPNGLNDTRANDFIKILETSGVKCESGGPGYYPPVPGATVSIFIGVDTE